MRSVPGGIKGSRRECFGHLPSSRFSEGGLVGFDDSGIIQPIKRHDGSSLEKANTFLTGNKSARRALNSGQEWEKL